MKLTLKQKAALVRLLDTYWRPPERGRTPHERGVLRQGWHRTLSSLKLRDLVRDVREPRTLDDGREIQVYSHTELTEEGRKLAKELSAAKDPQVMREATR